MRKYVLGVEPGIDSLHIDTTEEPAVGERDVLVDMRAWSLNFRDLLVVEGKYGGKYVPGLVPFSDGAGEVIRVGAGVTEFKVGDRVASCFFRDWQEGLITAAKSKSGLGGSIPGVLSERVAMPEWAWVRSPAAFSFAEAATLPCAAVTAWNSLFDTGNLAPGQTVLLQGTGGVSIFALQFAKAAGARAIVTSSSDGKLGLANEIGADFGINYERHPDWEKVAFEHTGGQGLDLVLDVGGSETLSRSLRAVRPGGMVAVIGVLSGGVAEVPLGLLLSKNIRMTGIYVGSRSQFQAMNQAIEQIGLSPVIDRTYPFGDVAGALRRLKSGEHLGKIVVAR